MHCRIWFEVDYILNEQILCKARRIIKIPISILIEKCVAYLCWLNQLYYNNKKKEKQNYRKFLKI